MRALPLLALLLLPTPALADNFVEIAGGVMIPAGDDVWTDYVESGPKLGVRLGGYGEQLGAILSADWTPVNTDAQGFQIGGFSQDISAHRFRLLASLGAQKHLAAKMSGTLRIGGGLDIARVAVTTVVGGNSSTAADTDLGLGLEVAGGLWFNIGNMQLGGELALPISWHDDDTSGDVDLQDYMAVDIDLMFAVRFLMK